MEKVKNDPMWWVGTKLTSDTAFKELIDAGKFQTHVAYGRSEVLHGSTCRWAPKRSWRS